MSVRRQLLAVLLLVAGVAGGAPAAAAATDPDDGLSLTVTVLPSGETPTPTPTPSASTGGSGWGSHTDTPPEESPDTGAEPDETGIGGLLYVSGVTTRSAWSWHHLGTRLIAGITVRNASSETFDVRARFWLDGPFANRLAVSREIDVRDLAPGERRLVELPLDGAGQWTFVRVSAQVTPPEELAADAAPLVRETWVFVIPWAIAVLIVLAGAGLAIWRIRRAFGTDPARAVAPAGGPA